MPSFVVPVTEFFFFFLFFFILKFLTRCLQHWLTRNPPLFLNWELSWYFSFLNDVTISNSIIYWSNNTPSNKKVALLVFNIDFLTYRFRYRIKIKLYIIAKILFLLNGTSPNLITFEYYFYDFGIKELRNFFSHGKTIVEKYPSYMAQKIPLKHNFNKNVLKSRTAEELKFPNKNDYLPKVLL